ncbi:MAG TPA: hypothetical protein DEG13_04165, partial [Candidatus Microthrix parvicella]|nr:hypothetical protein [Candidatus Microthrix parvicella]
MCSGSSATSAGRSSNPLKVENRQLEIARSTGSRMTATTSTSLSSVQIRPMTSGRSRYDVDFSATQVAEPSSPVSWGEQRRHQSAAPAL